MDNPPEFLEASYDSDLYYEDSSVIERLRDELRDEAEKAGVDIDDYKFDRIIYEARAYRIYKND
jgi:hypothetical protein